MTVSPPVISECGAIGQMADNILEVILTNAYHLLQLM